jgi:hypothetical protein
MSGHGKKGGGFEKYMSAFGAKSGELFSIARIRFDLYCLNREKEKLLQKVGASVYSMYRKGKYDQDRISEKCKSVVEIDEQIKRKEKEINHVHKDASGSSGDAIYNKRYKPGSHGGHEKDETKALIPAESWEVDTTDQD